MKNIALIALCGLLTGCGTEVKKLGPRADPKAKDDKSSCAGTGLPAFHEVSVVVNDILPAKIALELEGEMKLSECPGVDPSEPETAMDRETVNKLKFTVMHGKFFRTLPKSVSFRVLDMGDCKVTPREIVAKVNIPLVFVRETPKGPKCGTNVYARVLVSQD
jgi:hypothetical protein